MEINDLALLVSKTLANSIKLEQGDVNDTEFKQMQDEIEQEVDWLTCVILAKTIPEELTEVEADDLKQYKTKEFESSEWLEFIEISALLMTNLACEVELSSLQKTKQGRYIVPYAPIIAIMLEQTVYYVLDIALEILNQDNDTTKLEVKPKKSNLIYVDFCGSPKETLQ